MKPCYIHSIASISAQETFNNSSFLETIVLHEGKTATAIRPNYKNFIPPTASRRMATGVKMGVVTAKIALEEANNIPPDAIITGTGMGCIEDSEKFLNSILENDEQYLTPTSFIQSTHNTVGAQIALGIHCKGYNVTYVNGANSFEAALTDAQLALHEATVSHVLVGGVDELGKKFNHEYVFLQDTLSVPLSEGAHFFTLGANKQENSYAVLTAVDCIQSISLDAISQKTTAFLQHNNFTEADIDLVVFGTNGDTFDAYYETLQNSLFQNATHIHYKHLSGEYHTASAFGLWAASKILKEQTIPKALLMNDIEKKQYKNVLLYNQYQGEYHSFILLSAC